MIPFPPYRTQPDPQPDRPTTTLDVVILSLVAAAWVLTVVLIAVL